MNLLDLLNNQLNKAEIEKKELLEKIDKLDEKIETIKEAKEEQDFRISAFFKAEYDCRTWEPLSHENYKALCSDLGERDVAEVLLELVKKHNDITIYSAFGEKIDTIEDEYLEIVSSDSEQGEKDQILVVSFTMQFHSSLWDEISKALPKPFLDCLIPGYHNKGEITLLK